MVAGVLATLLAYDESPFRTDANIAEKAKKILQTRGYWRRITNGDPVIWNLVQERDNPKKADADVVSTSTAAPTTTSMFPTTTSLIPTPTQLSPYVQGTCHIHVSQWNMDGNGDYDLEVTMTDNDGYQIGYSARGSTYSNSDDLGMTSKLEDTVWCIPEKKNDYIQFGLGAQQWASDRDFADGAVPSCSVGRWDGDDNPAAYPVSCILLSSLMTNALADVIQKRQMDCSFVCTWGGGASSDGSD